MRNTAIYSTSCGPTARNKSNGVQRLKISNSSKWVACSAVALWDVWYITYFSDRSSTNTLDYCTKSLRPKQEVGWVSVISCRSLSGKRIPRNCSITFLSTALNIRTSRSATITSGKHRGSAMRSSHTTTAINISINASPLWSISKYSYTWQHSVITNYGFSQSYSLQRRWVPHPSLEIWQNQNATHLGDVVRPKVRLPPALNTKQGM